MVAINTCSHTAVFGADPPISHALLADHASALAEWFEQQHIGCLGLHLDNGRDWIIADMACEMAGVCTVPIPSFFSTGQLQHIIHSMPMDMLISDQPQAIARAITTDGLQSPLDLPGLYELISCWRFEPRFDHMELPLGTGKVTFTSGSTGQPKGVCLSRLQLQLQAEALAAAVGIDQPRHLCLLPLTTLLEDVAGVRAPLSACGSIIVLPTSELGFAGSRLVQPRRLLQAIERWQPETLITTPQLLQGLTLAAASGWPVPGSLQFVAVGGARVAPDNLQRARSLGIPAFEGYGLSECASVVSLNRPDSDRPGSAGQVLPHLQVHVSDGEVHVTGNAMLGYAGEPSSWYATSVATGDLGRLDEDGYLHIHGRRKNLLINSFGRNISPEWVETELAAEGIWQDCLVFGDDRPYCVALLSPRNPDESDSRLQAAIDRANARLPDYGQVQAWQRLSQPLAQQSGLLTENGRPRRDEILRRYGPAIESMYPASLSSSSPTTNNL